MRDRRHRFAGGALDGCDLAGDLFRRLRGLGREIFYLAGDDRESLAGVAGPRRFDRRVQRQKVGLARDRLDQLNDGADLFRGAGQPADQFGGPLRLAGCPA